MDHSHRVETLILRGPVDPVQAFADSILAQPGPGPRTVSGCGASTGGVGQNR